MSGGPPPTRRTARSAPGNGRGPSRPRLGAAAPAPAPFRRSAPRRLALRAAAALALGATLAGVGAPALAQEPPAATAPGSADAAGALDRARESLQLARVAPDPRHPDAAPWRQALNDATAALRAASGTPAEAEARELLAWVYQGVRWWSRAHAEWERLEALGAELSPEARAAWRDAAMQVAVARYARGDLAGAAAGFEDLLARWPEDVEALRWSARIALERGQDDEAVAAWTRVVEARPDDEGARFYLDVARERARHGREASDAFREGLARYEAGAPAEALAAFETAAAAAPGWREPAWWRARTLLETGREEAAVAAWEALVAADPDDADAAWFLERARLQARVGRDAAVAAEGARAAEEEGDAAGAIDAWRRAVEAAPDWWEATLSLGRVALAGGDAATAEDAFEAVLDHDDASDAARAEARAGLDQAAVQERIGGEAGVAYATALDAYDDGDAAAAEAGFRRAVSLAPDFVEGWAWLGRLAFAQRDWAAAAEAYGRASELEPASDDYAFFAREAARLADAERAEAAEPDEPEGAGEPRAAEGPRAPDEADAPAEPGDEDEPDDADDPAGRDEPAPGDPEDRP